jgi:hypothetical protein
MGMGIEILGVGLDSILVSLLFRFYYILKSEVGPYFVPILFQCELDRRILSGALFSYFLFSISCSDPMPFL